VSILEAIRSVLIPVANDQPPGPLHVGEVMVIWTYKTMLDEALAYVEAGLNMTQDNELRRALADAMDQCRSHSQQVQAFMLKECIPLAQTPEPKPESSPERVPNGVRITDEELANGLVVKVLAGITMCCSGVTTSLRIDVGSMFLGHMVERLTFATTLRSMLSRRGWLKTPPFYLPPGRPHD